jgi:hypothetical protein
LNRKQGSSTKGSQLNHKETKQTQLNISMARTFILLISWVL